MRVALFGASGKIGRRVLARLVEKGVEVTVLVHTTPLPEELADRVSIVRGSVTDPTATLGKIFAGSTPYFLLILLAALIVLAIPGLASWLPNYML